MWKLVRLSLGYHLKALLLAWLVAILLSEIGLLILAIVSVYLVSAEDKERRLLLHLPLPVTRLQVGWARVVFPAMVFLPGALLAVLFASGVLAVVFPSGIPGSGGVTVAEAIWDELVVVAVLMFFTQLLLMLAELNGWASGRGLPRLLMAFLTLLAVLALTLIAWILLATFGSYPIVILGTVGLAVVLMGLTVYLFERRPSFASA
ncbi:MAG: hypothetical protein GY769_20330 [bacterium]|nr:hypothetical protein [bacterium]